MHRVVRLEVVRYSTGTSTTCTSLTIRSWLKESSSLVTDGIEIHQTALTLIKSDRRAQSAVYDVSKLHFTVARVLLWTTSH